MNDDVQVLTSDASAELARAQKIEAEMAADGRVVSDSGQVDYFAFGEMEQVTLPDGHSWVQIKALNEGGRRRYQNQVTKSIRLQRTGDAIMDMNAGTDRALLVEMCLEGWNLRRNGAPVACDDPGKRDFMNRADPRIIDLIYKKAAKLNPWLVSELTVEEIDAQIAELEEMKRSIVEREEGNDS